MHISWKLLSFLFKIITKLTKRINELGKPLPNHRQTSIDRRLRSVNFYQFLRENQDESKMGANEYSVGWLLGWMQKNCKWNAACKLICYRRNPKGVPRLGGRQWYTATRTRTPTISHLTRRTTSCVLISLPTLLTCYCTQIVIGCERYNKVSNGNYCMYRTLCRAQLLRFVRLRLKPRHRGEQ